MAVGSLRSAGGGGRSPCHAGRAKYPPEVGTIGDGRPNQQLLCVDRDRLGMGMVDGDASMPI
jgi:hypothetical protein